MLYLVVFVAIIAISVSAFAATATITNTNNAGYQGVYVQDNGYYGVAANFYVVNTGQTATTQPLAWAPNGVGYVNALVAGDWDITLTLTINAGGLTSHQYTITVYSTPTSGAIGLPLFTFQFTSPATITPTQTMSIIWDVGATTWAAPYALTITIA